MDMTGGGLSTLKEKLTHSDLLPVVSIIKTSSVCAPLAIVVASSCHANSPDCLIAGLDVADGLLVR